jgi:hypothetical protein
MPWNNESVTMTATKSHAAETGMKQVHMIDSMYGSAGEITARFNPKDVVRLQCSCNYDPKLKGAVDILRKIEFKGKDGVWRLYPSVSLIDGIDHANHELQFTRALVRRTGEQNISVMSTPNGAMDFKLVEAAQAAGVLSISIER